MSSIDVSDSTKASNKRQEKYSADKRSDIGHKPAFEGYPEDIKMRALSHLSAGHTLSYVQTLLTKEGFDSVPTIVTLGSWRKKLPTLARTTNQQKQEVQCILDSTKSVTKDFEWLHDINRSLIERYYKDPDKYSRDLMLSIREFHSQLRTAMEKLDMLKSSITVNYDMRSIMLTNEFNVATHKFLEDLVRDGKITIHDDMLRTMVLGKDVAIQNTDR